MPSFPLPQIRSAPSLLIVQKTVKTWLFQKVSIEELLGRERPLATRYVHVSLPFRCKVYCNCQSLVCLALSFALPFLNCLTGQGLMVCSESSWIRLAYKSKYNQASKQINNLGWTNNNSLCLSSPKDRIYY